MKHLNIILALCMLSGFSHAAGITSTKHNLSTSGTFSNHLTAGTDQICVFCHTPHGSNTSAPVPLWNKKIPTGATYTLYSSLNTPSLEGEVLTIGSVSMACLSCHDGTQAMDNMMNAPGAGGYNAAGARPSGYTWTGAPATGLLPSGITNLGADLTNDHPIGIEYCGGGISGSSTTVSGTCTDADFISPSISTTSDGRTATLKTASINSNQVFWVDLDGNSTRGKADINLYTRTFAAGANRPSVECGSCHDPHVESKGSDNIMFMRVTTAGSKICLSCHVK